MTTGSPLVFDRFLRYDELSASLHALADAFPNLVTLEPVSYTHLTLPTNREV